MAEWRVAKRAELKVASTAHWKVVRKVVSKADSMAMC